ncbi:hypothetical protein LXL04_036215 [Taraxacum kok-saghyz]
MFVFLKPADSEASARPLLSADVNQCLQTSSNFLNLITSAGKDWRSLLHRDSTACSGSSSHRRCLIVAVFSPDRRRFQPHHRRSSASLIAGALLGRFQPTDPDFSRVLLYRVHTFPFLVYEQIILKGLNLDPHSDNAIILAIQNDRYYCFFVPLTLPVIVVAVYFYWLSMKMFKHA